MTTFSGFKFGFAREWLSSLPLPYDGSSAVASILHGNEPAVQSHAREERVRA